MATRRKYPESHVVLSAAEVRGVLVIGAAAAIQGWVSSNSFSESAGAP